MNERIQQLAVAAAPANSSIPQSEWNIPKEFIEKFAELIVAECADLFVGQKYMILNPHEPFANERVRALKEHDKDTVRKIKKHFGVTE